MDRRHRNKANLFRYNFDIKIAIIPWCYKLVFWNPLLKYFKWLCRIHLIIIKFSILWRLYIIHLKVTSLFCIRINLGDIFSPNNLFMTDTIVSFLLRWLYRIFESHVSFLFCICHEFSILVHLFHILMV